MCTRGNYSQINIHEGYFGIPFPEKKKNALNNEFMNMKMHSFFFKEIVQLSWFIIKLLAT
jgi:hypothetical protein